MNNPHSPWTADRLELLRVLAVERLPLSEILARINVLPGKPVGSRGGISSKLQKIGALIGPSWRRDVERTMEEQERSEAFAMFTAGRNVRYVEAELSCGLNLATLWHAEWLSQRDRVERKVAAMERRV